jgi:alpha-dioxygenase
LVPGARLGLEVWGFRGGVKWTDGDILAVYRDRERQNCRYNEFRRRMFMPTIRKWEDLTTDKETLVTIRELYGDDVERLDLLVGLLVEKKIPGFAISETAFFIFLIMASR